MIAVVCAVFAIYFAIAAVGHMNRVDRLEARILALAIAVEHEHEWGYTDAGIAPDLRGCKLCRRQERWNADADAQRWEVAS